MTTVHVGGDHLQKLIQLEGKTLCWKKRKKKQQVSGSFQGSAPLGREHRPQRRPECLVNTIPSLLTAMRHLLCARPTTLQILERILSPNSKSNILFIRQILPEAFHVLLTCHIAASQLQNTGCSNADNSANEATTTPVQALVWRHLPFPVSRGACFGGQARGWGYDMAGGAASHRGCRPHGRDEQRCRLVGPVCRGALTKPTSGHLKAHSSSGSSKQVCMCKCQTVYMLHGRVTSAQLTFNRAFSEPLIKGLRVYILGPGCLSQVNRTGDSRAASLCL